MNYFIHFIDPGFPAPPWPGQRRIGPFLTLEEATSQAASDAATGYGVGEIYSEKDSATLADPDKPDPRPTVTAEDVKQAGDQIVKERVAAEFRSRAEDDQALANFLPADVTVDDLRKEGLIT